MSFSVRANYSPRDRIDWPAIRNRLDMAQVATALLGPAPGRRGEGGRRLWWPCPFHQDANPSLCIDPGKPIWRCFGCGEHGDAAALVMRLQGVAFPEAIRWLAEQAGIATPSGKPARPRPPAASPVKPPEKPPEGPSGLPEADALALVQDASERIWTPSGSTALEYLRRDRGLTEATIKAARLGWVRSVMIPKADGVGFFKASGVTIPWHDAGRLTLVKIRQPEGREPRYAQAFADCPTLFPSMASIRPGAPLVVVEGELDALLLGQELGELAAVITTGSASNGPSGRTLTAALASPRWFAAHDADLAGEKAAALWPARAIRVRPPAGKDWTEARHAGIDLRRWWVEEHFADEFDRQERAAIYEFDTGMSREAAERLAGALPMREGARPCRRLACRATND